MTGIIGVSPNMRSGVLGKPPAGTIRQIKFHNVGDNAATTSNFNHPGTAVGFDNKILASSHVILIYTATGIQNDTTAGTHFYPYWNGGSFGSTNVGGNVFANALFYGVTIQYTRESFAGQVLDVLPASSGNPLYSIYFALESINLEIQKAHLTLIEKIM